MKKKLNILEKQLGYKFADRKLLKKALTVQTKMTVEPSQNNERFEFLGDRILGLVLADLLETFMPKASVGELSDQFIKHARNDSKLSALGKEYKLYEYTSRTSTKSLADTMEALIGAIFIDSKRSYSLAKAFIAKHWAIELGLPSREVLPFYVIKHYDDEQLIRGLLKLGLDSRNILKLEEEKNKKYQEVIIYEITGQIRQGMREGVNGGLSILGNIYDYENNSSHGLSPGQFFQKLTNDRKKYEIVKKIENDLSDQLKIPIQDLKTLKGKSLIEVACLYQRISTIKVLIKYGAVIGKSCSWYVLNKMTEYLERVEEYRYYDYENNIRYEIEGKYCSSINQVTEHLNMNDPDFSELYEKYTSKINCQIEQEVLDKVLKLKTKDFQKLKGYTHFVNYLIDKNNVEIDIASAKELSRIIKYNIPRNKLLFSDTEFLEEIAYVKHKLEEEIQFHKLKKVILRDIMAITNTIVALSQAYRQPFYTKASINFFSWISIDLVVHILSFLPEVELLHPQTITVLLEETISNKIIENSTREALLKTPDQYNYALKIIQETTTDSGRGF